MKLNYFSVLEVYILYFGVKAKRDLLTDSCHLRTLDGGGSL